MKMVMIYYIHNHQTVTQLGLNLFDEFLRFSHVRPHIYSPRFMSESNQRAGPITTWQFVENEVGIRRPGAITATLCTGNYY